MKKLIQLLIPILLITVSCKVEPDEIEYGKDGCHFCKMTIVDNQHAAELVTAKGKGELQTYWLLTRSEQSTSDEFGSSRRNSANSP